MTRPIDAILVPRGAEYQAVARGWRRAKLAAKVSLLAIPAGRLPVQQFLATAAIAPTTKVLLMGLGGALQPAWSVGGLALYRDCRVLPQPGATYVADAEMLAELQAILTVPAIAGLTSDRLVARASEKQALGQQSQAALVDMESAPVLAYFQRAAVLRVVSDDCRHDVPDLTAAFDATGKLRSLPLAQGLLQHPRAAARLIGGSLVGLRALAQAATTLAQALASRSP
ncbi:MAG: phosphorylase [Spirulinaceae cyanobacterium SM2_1_0]|nr:phosphorylase [Spirulinaceae cyanobacterium SM2_1_0]